MLSAPAEGGQNRVSWADREEGLGQGGCKGKESTLVSTFPAYSLCLPIPPPPSALPPRPPAKFREDSRATSTQTPQAHPTCQEMGVHPGIHAQSCVSEGMDHGSTPSRTSGSRAMCCPCLGQDRTRSGSSSCHSFSGSSCPVPPSLLPSVPCSWRPSMEGLGAGAHSMAMPAHTLCVMPVPEAGNPETHLSQRF